VRPCESNAHRLYCGCSEGARYYCCSAADNKIHKNGEIPSEILVQAKEDFTKNYAAWRGQRGLTHAFVFAVPN